MTSKKHYAKIEFNCPFTGYPSTASGEVIDEMGEDMATVIFYEKDGGDMVRTGRIVHFYFGSLPNN